MEPKKANSWWLFQSNLFSNSHFIITRDSVQLPLCRKAFSFSSLGDKLVTKKGNVFLHSGVWWWQILGSETSTGRPGETTVLGWSVVRALWRRYPVTWAWMGGGNYRCGGESSQRSIIQDSTHKHSLAVPHISQTHRLFLVNNIPVVCCTWCESGEEVWALVAGPQHVSLALLWRPGSGQQLWVVGRHCGGSRGSTRGVFEDTSAVGRVRLPFCNEAIYSCVTHSGPHFSSGLRDFLRISKQRRPCWPWWSTGRECRTEAGPVCGLNILLSCQGFAFFHPVP